MVEYLLGCADLLDESVLHDNDTVAQGHGLGLVTDEAADVRGHEEPCLIVQSRERLIQQQKFGRNYGSHQKGQSLPLTAGKCFRLTVQILGDIQRFGGFLHTAVNLCRAHFTELQGEGHVLIHRHMGIEGVGLEDHGDIPVLGFHVVHELPVDVQLAAGNLLQARYHPQRGRLAAAGGPHQDDELLILDIQVKGLNGNHALIRHLKVRLFLGSALLGLFLSAAVGINLGDAL